MGRGGEGGSLGRVERSIRLKSSNNFSIGGFKGCRYIGKYDLILK